MSSQLHALQTELDSWEKESRLRLRGGKGFLRNSVESSDRALAGAKDATQRFLTVDLKLSGKKDKSSIETDQQVTSSLTSLYTSLVQAEKQGKYTEKLLREAKAQGDKEAAAYMRYAPPKPPATATTKK